MRLAMLVPIAIVDRDAHAQQPGEVGRGLAQIVAGNGVCWEKPYGEFDVNTSSDFKAAGP